ncbi:hypothetical protein LX36DRAFT_707730 [Colletotrichum falcatum]|nr:hypothetical protein LX36DRAFT_707730 [Colletotrichum falcatum]
MFLGGLNVPADLRQTYGLAAPPPLFIGFTRGWPLLLRCVLSYIAAGWPADGIHVVENTGAQLANSRGRLTLQNPSYLNHTTLARLGVNDVLVYSFEAGPDDRPRPGDRPWHFYDDADRDDALRPTPAGHPAYRTIYENCQRDLNATLARGERWAFRWYQDDHLTLVNRDAMDAVGGWDSLIPCYATDCDMNARLAMDGWSTRHRRVGIINDVSTQLEDLAVLYRRTVSSSVSIHVVRDSAQICTTNIVTSGRPRALGQAANTREGLQ